MRTLCIIKPDAIEKKVLGEIISFLEKRGFEIKAQRMVWLDKKQAGRFYSVHKDKPFYHSLTDFMSSGPCVVMVLEKPNAVEDLRTVMGATDPKKAQEGSIRKLYGTDVEKNAIHGSDSPENAEKEIRFFFSEMEIF